MGSRKFERGRVDGRVEESVLGWYAPVKMEEGKLMYGRVN